MTEGEYFAFIELTAMQDTPQSLGDRNLMMSIFISLSFSPAILSSTRQQQRMPLTSPENCLSISVIPMPYIVGHTSNTLK